MSNELSEVDYKNLISTLLKLDEKSIQFTAGRAKVGKLVQVHPMGMEGGYFVQNQDGSMFFQATAASGAGYADSKLVYYVWRGNYGADEFRCHGYASGFLSP